MRKGFAPLVLVIIVLVVATIGAVAYTQLKPKFTSQPEVSQSAPTTAVQPSPTPDASREPNGSAETANWKIYTSKIFKYSVKYPDNWKADVKSYSLGGEYPVETIHLARDITTSSDMNPEPNVVIWGNYQSDLCFGAGRCKEENYSISGVKGKKLTDIVDGSEDYYFVLNSKNPKNEVGNVVILVQPNGEKNLTDQILSTFRFLD